MITDRASWVEYMLGNHAPGRFAWRLEDVKALRTPILYRGAQGFFGVPDELVLAEVNC